MSASAVIKDLIMWNFMDSSLGEQVERDGGGVE